MDYRVDKKGFVMSKPNSSPKIVKRGVSNMSFEEQVDLFTSYEPSYGCTNCGYPDVSTRCPICGSTHLELRQTREEYEEVHRRRR